MTAEYTEHPESGYFNCWSGRYPTAAVRTLDLYMAWRDGEVFPPLAAFENLRGLVIPGGMLTAARVAEVARTQISSLEVIMHDGPELPPGVFDLENLEALELSGCGLAVLPDLFARLPRLASLDLGHNRLESLPASLLASPTLTRLNLGFNRISRTPAFTDDSRLEQLDLSANPLTTLDVDVLPRGLTSLKVLADLEAVGDGLAELVHLRVLALGSKLRALPDLQRLTGLVEVQLAGTLGEALFDRLPASLEQLRGYGSHCVGLERIPPAIGRFTRLRVLELLFERITELAPELRQVPLDRLTLSCTKLGDTPSYAHLPDTLQCLELANVGMTKCPDRIAELVELRTLVLSANRLTAIPEAVRGLPLLTDLKAEGQRP